MKKNGFTLIELLAVIVILAIIALIAVPIVLGIINDSKESSKKESIELYIDTAIKAVSSYQITHPGFNPSICEIQTNGSLDCEGSKIKVEMKGQVPESGTITFNSNNKITYSVELDGMEYTLNSEGIKKIEPAPIPATKEDYRGYYADVNNDGMPDGVIYADLNKSSEIGAQWNNSDGTYSYTAKINLNEYTVSKNKYNGKFGEKEIIKLKKDKNNERFYIIALEDFTTSGYTTYYWYYGAFNRMSSKITSNNFGEGKENTRKMIEKWNAAGTSEGYENSPQNNRDIWKHIQEEYEKGWYIPSSGEWAAFADYMSSREQDKVIFGSSGNFKNTYGLSNSYWSSSQGSVGGAWNINFENEYMYNNTVDSSKTIRLGKTF